MSLPYQTHTVKLNIPPMMAEMGDRLFVWIVAPSVAGMETPQRICAKLKNNCEDVLVPVAFPAGCPVDRELTITRLEVYSTCDYQRSLAAFHRSRSYLADGEPFPGQLPVGWTGSWNIEPRHFKIQPPMIGAWQFTFSRDQLAKEERQDGMMNTAPATLANSINTSTNSNQSTPSATQHAGGPGGPGGQASQFWGAASRARLPSSPLVRSSPLNPASTTTPFPPFASSPLPTISVIASPRPSSGASTTRRSRPDSRSLREKLGDPAASWTDVRTCGQLRLSPSVAAPPQEAAMREVAPSQYMGTSPLQYLMLQQEARLNWEVRLKEYESTDMKELHNDLLSSDASSNEDEGEEDAELGSLEEMSTRARIIKALGQEGYQAALEFIKTDGFRSGSATQALTLIRQAQFGGALSVQPAVHQKVEDEEDEAEHYQDADYDEDEDEEEDEVLPAEEEEDYQEIRGSVLLDVEMMKSANQAMKERLTIPPPSLGQNLPRSARTGLQRVWPRKANTTLMAGKAPTALTAGNHKRTRESDDAWSDALFCNAVFARPVKMARRSASAPPARPPRRLKMDC